MDSRKEGIGVNVGSINSILLNNVVEQSNVSKETQSFESVLNNSINDNAVMLGYLSKEHTPENLRHLEDGMSRIFESEDRYCSLCGSRIKEDGSCPICIVPTFISGKKQSHNQNISQINSNKLTMLPRNSRVGRKA